MDFGFPMVVNKIQPKLNVFTRVWQIYDEHRNILLQKLYFQRRVSRLQVQVLLLDCFILVGTSTTGIAGWALWNTSGFSLVWAGIAGFAATLTILKPILKLEDKVLAANNLHTEYSRIFRRYTQIVKDIAYRETLDKDIEERYEAVRNEAFEIEDMPQVLERHLTQLKGKVDSQLPLSSYWSPTSA
jgi:hypothetical protein